jgi:hypothetical protein
LNKTVNEFSLDSPNKIKMFDRKSNMAGCWKYISIFVFSETNEQFERKLDCNVPLVVLYQCLFLCYNIGSYGKMKLKTILRY